MSVYSTRKLRNLAAILMLLSGISHVTQLWFRETDSIALLTALLGMVYLLLALGLSGLSRFVLWAASVVGIAELATSVAVLPATAFEPLAIWHLALDSFVALLCLSILYRTRMVEMD